MSIREDQKSDIKADFDKFIAKHWSADETAGRHQSRYILPTIITGHLFLEKCINDALKSYFKNSQELEDMTFRHKIKILTATGRIPQKTLQALNEFNNIRNKFAHNLDYDLTLLQLDKVRLLPKTDIFTEKNWKERPNYVVKSAISQLAGAVKAIEMGLRIQN